MTFCFEYYSSLSGNKISDCKGWSDYSVALVTRFKFSVRKSGIRARNCYGWLPAAFVGTIKTFAATNDDTAISYTTSQVFEMFPLALALSLTGFLSVSLANQCSHIREIQGGIQTELALASAWKSEHIGVSIMLGISVR